MDRNVHFDVVVCRVVVFVVVVNTRELIPPSNTTQCLQRAHSRGGGSPICESTPRSCPSSLPVWAISEGIVAEVPRGGVRRRLSTHKAASWRVATHSPPDASRRVSSSAVVRRTSSPSPPPPRADPSVRPGSATPYVPLPFLEVVRCGLFCFLCLVLARQKIPTSQKIIIVHLSTHKSTPRRPLALATPPPSLFGKPTGNEAVDVLDCGDDDVLRSGICHEFYSFYYPR